MGNSVSARCISSRRLDGKTAIVTGANSGIGKETAKDFYTRGCNVTMVCRNKEKAEEAMEDIEAECEHLNRLSLGKLDIAEMDLANMMSIRKCAMTLNCDKEHIHILINNAGVMTCPFARTIDGFEMQFGTNYLGHFLFTLLLLPKIIESRPSRIVNVTSKISAVGSLNFADLNWETRPYSPLRAYTASKLSQVLFTRELARRLRERRVFDVTVYAAHPGIVATRLFRHVGETFHAALAPAERGLRRFMRTPRDGARTVVGCAVDDALAADSGLFYADCRAREMAVDAGDAARLWERSVEYARLGRYDPFASARGVDGV